MKRLLMFGIVFLTLLFSSYAITFSGVNVSSEDNTTSIYFDKAITMDNLVIYNDSIYLDNFYLTGCDALLYSGYFSKNYTTGTYLTSTFNTLYCPASLTQEQTTSAFTGYIVVFVFFSICISFIVSIILVVMVGMSKLKIIDKQIMFMLLLFMFISVVALMVAMLNIMLELGLQT